MTEKRVRQACEKDVQRRCNIQPFRQRLHDGSNRRQARNMPGVDLIVPVGLTGSAKTNRSQQQQRQADQHRGPFTFQRRIDGVRERRRVIRLLINPRPEDWSDSHLFCQPTITR